MAVGVGVGVGVLVAVGVSVAVGVGEAVWVGTDVPVIKIRTLSTRGSDAAPSPPEQAANKIIKTKKPNHRIRILSLLSDH